MLLSNTLVDQGYSARTAYREFRRSVTNWKAPAIAALLDKPAAASGVLTFRNRSGMVETGQGKSSTLTRKTNKPVTYDDFVSNQTKKNGYRPTCTPTT